MTKGQQSMHLLFKASCSLDSELANIKANNKLVSEKSPTLHFDLDSNLQQIQLRDRKVSALEEIIRIQEDQLCKDPLKKDIAHRWRTKVFSLLFELEEQKMLHNLEKMNLEKKIESCQRNGVVEVRNYSKLNHELIAAKADVKILTTQLLEEQQQLRKEKDENRRLRHEMKRLLESQNGILNKSQKAHLLLLDRIKAFERDTQYILSISSQRLQIAVGKTTLIKNELKSIIKMKDSLVQQNEERLQENLKYKKNSDILSKKINELTVMLNHSHSNNEDLRTQFHDIISKHEKEKAKLKSELDNRLRESQEKLVEEQKILKKENLENMLKLRIGRNLDNLLATDSSSIEKSQRKAQPRKEGNKAIELLDIIPQQSNSKQLSTDSSLDDVQSMILQLKAKCGYEKAQKKAQRGQEEIKELELIDNLPQQSNSKNEVHGEIQQEDLLHKLKGLYVMSEKILNS